MNGIITTFKDKPIEGYIKIDKALVYDDTIVVEKGFKEFYSVGYNRTYHDFFMSNEDAYEVSCPATGKFAFLKKCPFEVKIVFGPKVKSEEDVKLGELYISKDGNILLEAVSIHLPNYYLKYKNDWVFAGNRYYDETEWHSMRFDIKSVLLCLKALKIKLPKVLCFLIMKF